MSCLELVLSELLIDILWSKDNSKLHSQQDIVVLSQLLLVYQEVHLDQSEIHICVTFHTF